MTTTSPPVSVLAVIPARGGSRGVTNKNLRRVGGVTLVERAVAAARACPAIDAVVVSTDDDAIAMAAAACGAGVLARPGELATDTATSESVLVHALDSLDPPDDRHCIEVLVMIQCTSPFINPSDLAQAVGVVRSGEVDCAFAACESHAFLWRNDTGQAEGVNHDPARRLRRQDMVPQWRETGAFYAMDAKGFRTHQHRFFGRIGIVAMDPAMAVDIDSEADLELAQLMAMTSEHRTGTPVGLDQVKAVITDFDGVHTDDGAWVSQSGEELVRVNRRDGLGVSQLKHRGIRVLILSTEVNGVVRRRAEKLGVECIDSSVDKATDLMRWLTSASISPHDALYIGNDVNDLPALEIVGWPVAVADARAEVRAAARLVTERHGGQGAVREIADLITGALT